MCLSRIRSARTSRWRQFSVDAELHEAPAIVQHGRELLDLAAIESDTVTMNEISSQVQSLPSRFDQNRESLGIDRFDLHDMKF